MDSRELESAVIAQKAVHLSQQFTKFKTAKSIIHERYFLTSLVGAGVGGAVGMFVGAGVGGFEGAGVGCASEIRKDNQSKGFNMRR